MLKPPANSMPGTKEKSFARVLWQLPQATGPLTRYSPRLRSVFWSSAAAGKAKAKGQVVIATRHDTNIFIGFPNQRAEGYWIQFWSLDQDFLKVAFLDDPTREGQFEF